MRVVQTGSPTGLVGLIGVLPATLLLVGLLGGLTATVGLTGTGWAVGLACGVVLAALLGTALSREGAAPLSPADRITLTRAVGACGVAALTADAFVGSPAVGALVGLAGVGLVLDAVDGQVARRTGTVSARGARFDMEVDAFLILVLSVYVARGSGTWVLLIGLARYAILLAGWLVPWLRGSLPARRWRKVVAAVQGVVLVVVAADVLPPRVEVALLAGALGLLAASFGSQVWLLRAHRPPAPAAVPGPARTALGWALHGAAVVLLWAALVAPDRWGGVQPGAFLRIPLEGLVVVAVVLLLPRPVRRPAAATAGVALAVLTLVRLLDMGFVAALGRPFDPVADWRYSGSAVSLLADSVGRRGATLAVLAAVLLTAAVLVVVPLAAVRVTGLADRHRRASYRSLVVLGLAWMLGAVSGLQLFPGAPVASVDAAVLARDHVSQVRATLRDQARFAKALETDPLAATPDSGLLAGLRGKDVLVVFVESYGRVAVEGSSFSPGVDAVLDSGTRQLRGSGYSARSAFLTSSTFGGLSWLAHSTVQSGLWINSQQRYDDLVASDRSTLAGAFRRAGWRTVADVPSNRRDWPQGRSFFGFDRVYGAGDVGYAGPSFSYATMPDQYVLSAFRRLELAPRDRAPVMAEIDLVSSHTPWAPLPTAVPWADVGDGSVFDGMPARGDSAHAVWRHPADVRAAYGRSVEYSLSTLVSFVRTSPDPNLVLVVLGDHQPATIVSGEGASHDVPVSVIAHDPAVLRRISGWGWHPGLNPGPDAPVWRMDAFRDRFLSAFAGASVAPAPVLAPRGAP